MKILVIALLVGCLMVAAAEDAKQKSKNFRLCCHMVDIYVVVQMYTFNSLKNNVKSSSNDWISRVAARRFV